MAKISFYVWVGICVPVGTGDNLTMAEIAHDLIRAHTDIHTYFQYQ
jgi:hypothetical protein